MATATLTKIEAKAIWAEATKAAEAAALAKVPTPMVVGSPTTPFGSDVDFTKKTYYVASGMCGFAWINIKPARGALVAYLKSVGIGSKGYGGGWQIWCNSELSPTAGATQSIEIKEAAAHAAAEVLRKYGIEAYAQSRLD
jgi:hypothetical protein